MSLFDIQVNDPVVYDCEIIRCIPNGVRFSAYEYCEGWDDFENMGISVICAMSLFTKEQKVFVCPELSGIQKFVEGRQVCGFNSRKFDDKLCKANGIGIKTDFDLLIEVRKAAFNSEDWRDQPQGFCYSLDAIARANNLSKSGSGALAPQLWQEGKHQEVIDYCLNDVRITRELILKFLKGELVDPNTGGLLKASK